MWNLIAWWSQFFFRTNFKTTGNSSDSWLLFAKIIFWCLSLYRYFLFLIQIQRLLQRLFALIIFDNFAAACGNLMLLVLKLDWLLLELWIVEGVTGDVIYFNTTTTPTTFWASVWFHVTNVDLKLRLRVYFELWANCRCVGSTMMLLPFKSLLGRGFLTKSCAVLQDWLHGQSVFACIGTSSGLD